MPPRLEGKGSCTQGYDTGDLPDQGKKLRVSNPTRLLPTFVEGGPSGPAVTEEEEEEEEEEEV